jgi:galactokinase
LIKVEAPARICFFGDHQDYLGLPVIAGTIDRKINLKAIPNNHSKYKIQLHDINKEISIDLDEELNEIQSEDYFRSGLWVLQQKGAKFSQGYDIEISGTIPVNAGVSSSSALVVAWLRFLNQAQELPQNVSNEQIGKWAYEAEVEYFNQSGGIMDQYTIAQGGLIFIDTQTEISTRLQPHFGTLILAESGIFKQTQTVLQNARAYGQKAIEAVQAQHPLFKIQEAVESDYDRYADCVPDLYADHWYAAIHNYILTLKAKKMLQEASVDIQQLGAWMNEHQQILEERIQNTPAVMQKQMAAARREGALGAKIIGSGGGGCMLALVPPSKKEAVIDAFLNAGAQAAYEVKLYSF